MEGAGIHAALNDGNAFGGYLVVIENVPFHAVGNGDQMLRFGHDGAVGVHGIHAVKGTDQGRAILFRQAPPGQPDDPGREPRADVNNIRLQLFQELAHRQYLSK